MRASADPSAFETSTHHESEPRLRPTIEAAARRWLAVYIWRRLGLRRSALSRPSHERPGAHGASLIRLRWLKPVDLFRVSQCPLSHLHEIFISHSAIVGPLRSTTGCRRWSTNPTAGPHGHSRDHRYRGLRHVWS
jgi:hypothetical protein